MKKLSLTLAAVLLAVIAYAAVEPSTIAWSVNFTGTTSPSDVRTAKWVVAKENARRAALSPVLPALPTSTAAELKASTLICLTRIVNNYWIESAATADAEAVERLSEENMRDIYRAITDRLNSGMTAQQVINLIKP